MSLSAVNLLAVAVGGAVGASMRYSAAVLTVSWFKDPHFNTIMVNIIGSLLIGYALNLIPHDSTGNDLIRLALFTGVLGGFTTFSAFSMETLILMQSGEISKALLNISFTIIGTLIAVWIGYEAGRMIHSL